MLMSTAYGLPSVSRSLGFTSRALACLAEVLQDINGYTLTHRLGKPKMRFKWSTLIQIKLLHGHCTKVNTIKLPEEVSLPYLTSGFMAHMYAAPT